MTLSKFLDSYKADNIYAVTVLPDEMRKEVKVLVCNPNVLVALLEIC